MEQMPIPMKRSRLPPLILFSNAARIASPCESAAQIDFNLSSDVFEASSFVVNIDLTHDAGVVDQNVELRKLFGDLFVKSGDRFRIGNVASKGVNCWKGRFRTVHLSLIAARDKNRVTKRRELFGEFVTDAAGTAGDQNRIAPELHN